MADPKKVTYEPGFEYTSEDGSKIVRNTDGDGWYSVDDDWNYLDTAWSDRALLDDEDPGSQAVYEIRTRGTGSSESDGGSGRRAPSDDNPGPVIEVLDGVPGIWVPLPVGDDEVSIGEYSSWSLADVQKQVERLYEKENGGAANGSLRAAAEYYKRITRDEEVEF